MSPIVISEVLGLFIIRLTADDKYSLLKRENLPQSIQMQLPEKQKNISEFFASLTSLLHLLHFFSERRN